MRSSPQPGTHKRGTCNPASLKIGNNYISEPDIKTNINNFMKWICPSVQKTSCTEHHHFNYRLMEHIVQKDTFISWSLPCVPTIGKWQLSTALDFKQMLLTDTWDYHWGAEGVIRHTGNICDLSDQASHQRAMAGSICIANIHYATQTQWWALKLKTKCWKFFKGGMSRMARNKKNNGVFGWHFLYKGIFILSTIWSEDVCITPENSPPLA